MTLKKAIKLLPKECKGLAKNPLAITVEGLRDVVRNELIEYRKGENPLSDKQVMGLYDFLSLTSEIVQS